MIELAYGKRSFASRQTNVAAQPVARIYAEALVGAAQAAGKLDETLTELDSFIVDVLQQYPKLETILSSARVTADEKDQLLERVLGSQASRLFLNFLKVVSQHGRLDIIRSIREAALELQDKLRGVTRVQVASAAPLDQQTEANLTGAVQKLLGGQPLLETEVWPELVGGLMLRVGDTVYDGSISTGLERIRQEMIDRSIHEIQSRRDSFGITEGN